MANDRIDKIRQEIDRIIIIIDDLSHELEALEECLRTLKSMQRQPQIQSAIQLTEKFHNNVKEEKWIWAIKLRELRFELQELMRIKDNRKSRLLVTVTTEQDTKDARERRMFRLTLYLSGLSFAFLTLLSWLYGLEGTKTGWLILGPILSVMIAPWFRKRNKS